MRDIERTHPAGPMDHRGLRYVGYLALGMALAWTAGFQALRILRSSGALWMHQTELVLSWPVLGIAAAYYGRAMARGIRPSRAGWALAASLALLPAGAVWALSGGEAALTAALALAAWIPFTVTWGVPVAGFLGARGRLAAAGLLVLCGAVPLAWLVLVGGVNLTLLAEAPEDASWRRAGFAAALTSLAVIVTASLLTRRARRAARAAAEGDTGVPS